jgi:hypothetical protein
MNPQVLTMCVALMDIHHPGTRLDPKLLVVPEFENGGYQSGYQVVAGTPRCRYAHDYLYMNKKGKLKKAVHVVELRLRDNETFHFAYPLESR